MQITPFSVLLQTPFITTLIIWNNKGFVTAEIFFYASKIRHTAYLNFINKLPTIGSNLKNASCMVLSLKQKVINCSVDVST
jgi:hypothetical protein